MGTKPRFFRKNLIDLSYDNVSFTVSDSVATNNGLSFVNYMLNRDNTSGWITTGSSDAGTTTIEATFDDIFQIDTLILVGHNFKSYTLKYWDADLVSWVDFSTTIAPTTNTKDTTFHQFDSVHTQKIQLIINGTQVADEDKILRQLIVTRKIENGILDHFPVLTKSTIDLGKRTNFTLSGKAKIVERIGAFGVTMQFKNWPSDNDMSLLEQLHFFHPRGFLFWPNGGDEEQFKYVRKVFRNQDIFLCGINSEWQPEWNRGIYVNGVGMNVKLVEVL